MKAYASMEENLRRCRPLDDGISTRKRTDGGQKTRLSINNR
ncbi:hypothetical protein L798_08598 [Zootermopsis nevadensis]|uniref:Uncharacterized protein n=1 Tax=Zootermopsis nevadensis TaxID=136037 RepID=A0A067R1M2_ZOONE|nr:hypothetical protein L798_08598 [Zootermopsis nevadensis]